MPSNRQGVTSVPGYVRLPMPAPLVSVVVTNHDYGRYLGQALDSALDQTHSPVEVVVVDDGSTDESHEVLRSFASRRVTALLQDCAGQAAAASAGFAICGGDVVIFLDADDVLLPTAAARAAAVLEVEGAVKVHWPLQTIDVDSRPLGGRFPIDPLPAGDLRPWLLAEGPGAVPFPPTSGNAWTRAFLSCVLPVPEGRYRFGLDTYLAALAPLYGLVDADIESHSLYRLHPDSGWSALRFRDRLDHDMAQDEVTRRTVAEHCALLDIDADPDRWRDASWFHKLSTAIDEIDPFVAGQNVVVVDEDQWGVDDSVGWQPRPFPEHDGTYWGPPADDAAALAELDRAIAAGVTRLVVAWPALWWLDHYTEFAHALRTRFARLLSTERVEVFALDRRP
jgi:glycosyltransferase involved in cell wall biosynthesis